ncbi:MAG: rod shape-determining protein MreC [Brevundimonas sp.]|uniref:rod shape-determining protein MreC n=1 Tax=Brevundimonas sp. TaxID=1871086 RepID=UPI00120ED670|nr:rod shape-determining protein MreC [Brevundimonas sp.]RZJ19508.1 MAG: rod shape-determining protein MreC [Brevundimonas sp.]
MAFRDGPFENLKVPLAWTAAAVVIVAIVLSVLLLLGDRREAATADSYGPTRAAVDTVTGPVGGVLAAPVRWAGAASDFVGGYFFAVSENRRLRRELAELQPWRDQAIALKNVNARYEAMLGIRTEPPVAMVTARSISESRGPFVNARLLDVGAAKGVRVGNPVINEHGLVGRVTGTSAGISRLVLLTDVASRTPVLVDRTDARAILTGDGSGNPRLEFLRGNNAVQAGDRILTSGDGGGYPRGVPIGVAAKGIDGSWRVKLFSDRGAIDYVRVMLFQDFGQLADVAALSPPPLTGLAAAPAPTAEQAAAIADAGARRDAAAAQRAATASAPATITTPTRPAPARPAAAPAAAPPRPTPTPAAPAAQAGGQE